MRGVDGVAQPHAGQVDGVGVRIVEFRPVGIAAAGACEGAVVGQQFIDHESRRPAGRCGFRLEPQAEHDVAAVSADLMHLGGECVFAWLEQRGVDRERPLERGIDDVPTGQHLVVRHDVRGHAEPQRLLAVEVEYRAVIDHRRKLQPDRRGVPAPVETGAEIKRPWAKR